MRLDLYLVEQELVKSRSEASDLIKRGFVLVEGNVITKTGYELKVGQKVSLTHTRKFVSRAGEKLKEALDTFHVSLKDYVVVDIGSSTGGFTDCALHDGAREVHAYDVGTDQMDETLRKDERIHLHEQTNILDVIIPDNDMVLIDVSFTSVKPIISHIAPQTKSAIVLLKPQFETDGKLLKNGVLKDQKMHQKVIDSFISHIKFLSFDIVGFTPSSLKGKDGNVEYLFYLIKRGI